MISKEALTFDLTQSIHRKKSRKQSLNSASIRNELPDDLVTIKTESLELFDETDLYDEKFSDPLDTIVKVKMLRVI